MLSWRTPSIRSIPTSSIVQNRTVTCLKYSKPLSQRFTLYHTRSMMNFLHRTLALKSSLHLGRTIVTLVHLCYHLRFSTMTFLIQHFSAMSQKKKLRILYQRIYPFYPLAKSLRRVKNISWSHLWSAIMDILITTSPRYPHLRHRPLSSFFVS